MNHSGLGSHIHSLSSTWSTESRGPRLHSEDFETRTQIRTGGKTVEAVLVLPVAVQTGKGNGAAIAEYPLYAAVAVDRDTLAGLEKDGLADKRHNTVSEASQQAQALNQASETAYLNDYQSGHLTGVQSWQKIDTASAPISIRPAANQSLSI